MPKNLLTIPQGSLKITGQLTDGTMPHSVATACQRHASSSQRIAGRTFLLKTRFPPVLKGRALSRAGSVIKMIAALAAELRSGLTPNAVILRRAPFARRRIPVFLGATTAQDRNFHGSPRIVFCGGTKNLLTIP